MGWESVAAYAGLAGMLLFAAISIVFHALPTGYSPLRNPVSDFATSSYRSLMIAAFLLLGSGVLALAAAFAAGLGAGKRIALGVFFIAAFGASRLLVAFFPSDVDGSERTAHGRLHTLFTFLGFFSIILAVIVLTPVFGRVFERAAWAGVYGTLRQLELVVFILGVVLWITRMKSLRPFFGLVERLFYLSSLAWLFVLGLHFALLKGANG